MDKVIQSGQCFCTRKSVFCSLTSFSMRVCIFMVHNKDLSAERYVVVRGLLCVHECGTVTAVTLAKLLREYFLHFELIAKAIIQNLLTKVYFCFINISHASCVIRKKNLLPDISSASRVYLAQK